MLLRLLVLCDSFCKIQQNGVIKQTKVTQTHFACDDKDNCEGGEGNRVSCGA